MLSDGYQQQPLDLCLWTKPANNGTTTMMYIVASYQTTSILGKYIVMHVRLYRRQYIAVKLVLTAISSKQDLALNKKLWLPAPLIYSYTTDLYGLADWVVGWHSVCVPACLPSHLSVLLFLVDTMAQSVGHMEITDINKENINANTGRCELTMDWFDLTRVDKYICVSFVIIFNELMPCQKIFASVRSMPLLE